MKVSQLPYERYSLEQVKSAMERIIAQVEGASGPEQVLEARKAFLKMLEDYGTAVSLSYMRYSINTADEFYVAEKDYYDEIDPQVNDYITRYYRAMLASPFRAELEKELSPLLFRSMEMDVKAMSPAIIEDMVEENRLVSEYSTLMAGMEFEFRGEKLPRPMLLKYLKSDDRQTRMEAMEVLGRTLEDHSEQLDGIYDKLVHVRHRMALKMGCKNFVELGYYRMGRLCYDKEKVAAFRANVLRDIAPLVSRLRLENAERMGIKDFMLYDNDVLVPGGDPAPRGKEDIFAAAKEMYHTMGPETGAFIDLMLDNEAFDVDSRKNKWGGGYCTSFPKYKQPFILANFNGTAGDVDVVTHEAGHALNSYLTADNRFALDLHLGMETAETHSMSMEFFAWPYMERFFGGNAEKYKYMHALDALSFIPYGSMVDAFQHIVYENPDMSPAQRNASWLELEKRFRPHIGLEGIPYLEKGTRWQYQMHIYETPFYYIDYCLAQTAAFNFLLASLHDYDSAFARYMRLSKQGGEKLWTELLEEAGFSSPFVPGALEKLGHEVEDLIETLAKKAL